MHEAVSHDLNTAMKENRIFVMDSPPRTSSESRTPLVQPHSAPTSDSAAQNPPRLQGGLSEHAAWNIPSAPKEKGKDVCCPSSGRNICVSADGTLGEFGERVSSYSHRLSTFLTLFFNRIAMLWNSKAVSRRTRIN